LKNAQLCRVFADPVTIIKLSKQWITRCRINNQSVSIVCTRHIIWKCGYECDLFSNLHTLVHSSTHRSDMAANSIVGRDILLQQFNRGYFSTSSNGQEFMCAYRLISGHGSKRNRTTLTHCFSHLYHKFNNLLSHMIQSAR